MATASTSSAGASDAAIPRFDFYQTDTAVTVSVFIKAALADQTSVDIAPRSLSVASTTSAGSKFALHLDPLFSSVDPATSSYKLLSTKIEVVLHKAQPGVRWNQLHAASGHSAPTPQVTSTTPAPQPPQAAQTDKSAAPRARSKWDSFDPDADDGDAAPAEADINAFFQKLYADADDNTRKAMIKSYQESGGTTLSTDWSKVATDHVAAHPPDGMEAKKW